MNKANEKITGLWFPPTTNVFLTRPGHLCPHTITLQHIHSVSLNQQHAIAVAAILVTDSVWPIRYVDEYSF